jgi:hypothetical protein
MPVASGAFGDVLYDGYSRLPCDTLILLAWPFSEVTANIVEWEVPVLFDSVVS